MNHVIIVTHGPLAAALLKSAEMILEEDLPDVKAICLGPQDNLDTARAKVELALAEAENGATGQGILVLVDLFGGTAANAAAWVLQDRVFEIVAGVNLPMLLEVLLNRDQMSAAQLADLAVKKGKQGVTDVGAALWKAPAVVAASEV